MVNIQAPECGINGCENRSWGPCARHSVPAPLPVDTIWTELKSVCPVVEGMPAHPDTARELARSVYIGAVKRECMRYFGLIDGPDPAARDAQLRQFRETLADQFTPTWFVEENYNPYFVIDLMGQSQDDLGGTVETANVVASYCLRAEWMLARSMGFAVDAYNRPSSVALPDYLFYHANEMREVVYDAFALAIREYPTYVYHAAQREPASHYRVADDLHWLAAERAQMKQQEINKERSRERWQKVGAFALTQLEEYNSPQARQTRAIERDRREAREARDRRERREIRESNERSKSRAIRDEYVGHLNRKHRGNSWFW